VPTVARLPTPVPTAEKLSPAIPVPPARDVYDLARRLRLRSTEPVERVSAAPPPTLAEGDHVTFWVHRNEGPIQTEATVQRVSEHAYWVFDDAADVDLVALDEAAAEFETSIWPTVTGLFGDIWTPGVDGDPRMVILHSTLLGGVGGYYSGVDEYPLAIQPFSNEREIVYISSPGPTVNSEAYLAVLTHELQHAVHWPADPGEETWLNEGLSELAADRAGYRTGNVDGYLRRPATSLTGWPEDVVLSEPHYGAAALFVEYLVTHYGGDDSISLLVQESADGLDSVDAYLANLGFAKTAIDVFGDWVVANYLNGGEDRYSYENRSLMWGMRPRTEPIVLGTPLESRVGQLGARYYAVRPDAPTVTVTFQGAPAAQLFPAAPASGQACWWGNAGDSIDSTLTREFDLRGVESATLRWRVWHDIEDGWDYAYVEASGDGGETWDILRPDHVDTDDPNGIAYGPGYTGNSGEWVSDQVDLSAYAGAPVLVRFEYVTDDAIHLDGLCLDDFEIAETGWADDAESDGGWTAEGFTRVGNEVPQEYLVQVVVGFGTDSPEVQELRVGPGGFGEVTIPTPDEHTTIVVIVSAITPDSRTDAPYTLTIAGTP